MTNTEITSILVTIIVGAFPFVIYIKKRFAISLNLLESYTFHKKLDKINVTYNFNGKQCENAFALKLIFRNYGKYDIDSSIIKKPLSIILPKELQYIEFVITDKNNVSKAFLNQINDNELQLNWELLKSGEQINMEILVINKSDFNESFTSIKIFEELYFDFRISNISVIKKNYILKKKITYFITRIYLVIIGTMLVLQGIPGFLPGSYTARNTLKYNIQLKEDSTFIYNAYVKDSDEVYLIDSISECTTDGRINNFFNYGSKVFNVKEFNKMGNRITISILKNNRKMSYIFCSLGITFLLIAGYSLFKRWKKKYE